VRAAQVEGVEGRLDSERLQFVHDRSAFHALCIHMARLHEYVNSRLTNPDCRSGRFRGAW
jgi:hypothetical protein